MTNGELKILENYHGIKQVYLTWFIYFTEKVSLKFIKLYLIEYNVCNLFLQKEIKIHNLKIIFNLNLPSSLSSLK